MGLLLAHKRTLRIYTDMISFSVPHSGPQEGGGKRGKIRVFSEDSRYRLFRLLHQLKFEKITFCTLTYPAEFPTDKKIYKAHLKEYRRRFERKYGPVRAVWRLEFQKRGAPHYHLMYLDAPHIPIGEWCELWSNVIKTDDENHRKIGVDVKLVTGGSEAALVASYLGKYVAKPDERKASEVTESPGRWWGKWNIEEEEPVTVELWESEAREITEALLAEKKKNNWNPKDPSLCTVFGGTMGKDDFQHRVIKLLAERIVPSRPKKKQKHYPKRPEWFVV